MKIVKSQLKVLIENFLKEETDWLTDDEDDLGDLGAGKLDKRLNNLKISCVNQIIDELSNSKFKDQSIPAAMLKAVERNLKNVSVVSSKATSSKEINLSSLAICFTPNITHTKEEDNLVLQTPEIPSDIKDIPKVVVDRYNSSPGKYPIILFLEKNIDKNLDHQKLKSILLHELGHVKNSTIKALSLRATSKFGKDVGNIQLNRNEIKAILRKDLKSKSVNEVVNMLVSEGWLDKNQTKDNQKLVIELKKYYDGVEDLNNIKAVEELAVRVSALKRNTPAFQRFVVDKEVDLYTNISKEFNLDIADIVLLMRKDISIDDVNSIVKLNNQPSKSVTV
jgi:ribosomal protein S8